MLGSHCYQILKILTRFPERLLERRYLRLTEVGIVCHFHKPLRSIVSKNRIFVAFSGGWTNSTLFYAIKP